MQNTKKRPMLQHRATEKVLVRLLNTNFAGKKVALRITYSGSAGNRERGREGGETHEP